MRTLFCSCTNGQVGPQVVTSNCKNVRAPAAHHVQENTKTATKEQLATAKTNSKLDSASNLLQDYNALLKSFQKPSSRTRGAQLTSIACWRQTVVTVLLFTYCSCLIEAVFSILCLRSSCPQLPVYLHCISLVCQALHTSLKRFMPLPLLISGKPAHSFILGNVPVTLKIPGSFKSFVYKHKTHTTTFQIFHLKQGL